MYGKFFDWAGEMCRYDPFAPSEHDPVPFSHPRLAPWVAIYRRWAAGLKITITNFPIVAA
jgi:hypothetical protein